MRQIPFFVFVLFPLCLYGQGSVGMAHDLLGEEEMMKAIDCYSQGKYTDAIAILRGYTERNPQDKEAFIMLGRSFVYSKDCTEALNIFKKIEPMLEQKDRDMVYMDIAQCYIQDKRYKEASDYLNSIKDTSSDRDRIAYLLGTLKMTQNDYKEARPLFRDLYEKSSVYKGRAAYYLSVIAQKENRIDESLKLIEVASKDRESEEGREAIRILEKIKSDKERYERRSYLSPFFKLRNSYVFDTNVPEMAESENENLKYLTNLGNVTMRWGARTDLELLGGVDFKRKGHRANVTLIYFSDFHFLPVNSIIPRSEFDVNYYDIMFAYAGTRYNYDFRINKNVLSPGLEVGLLNLLTDQYGSFLHEKDARSGPNFYLTSLSIAPNISFAVQDILIIKPYYRLKMDFYHQSVENAKLNSLSGIDNIFGLETSIGFMKTDTVFLRFEYDMNSADGSQWRYDGLRAGLGISFIALSIVDLRFLIEYFLRDFSDSSYVLEDGSTEARSDKRLSLSVGPEFLLGKVGRLGIKYNYILNQSNIKTIYDYNRQLGILFWEVKF